MGRRNGPRNGSRYWTNWGIPLERMDSSLWNVSVKALMSLLKGYSSPKRWRLVGLFYQYRQNTAIWYPWKMSSHWLEVICRHLPMPLSYGDVRVRFTFHLSARVGLWRGDSHIHAPYSSIDCRIACPTWHKVLQRYRESVTLHTRFCAR